MGRAARWASPDRPPNSSHGHGVRIGLLVGALVFSLAAEAFWGGVVLGTRSVDPEPMALTVEIHPRGDKSIASAETIPWRVEAPGAVGGRAAPGPSRDRPVDDAGDPPAGDPSGGPQAPE